MSGFNLVVLAGNLTRDPEVRHTPNGTAVGDFGLAVNKTYKNESGKKIEEVLFIDVTTWGRWAEISKQYLSKGSKILINGELKLDSWETPEGEKKTKIKVTAHKIVFLSKKSTSNQTASNEPQPQSNQVPMDEDDDIPF